MLNEMTFEDFYPSLFLLLTILPLKALLFNWYFYHNLRKFWTWASMYFDFLPNLFSVAADNMRIHISNMILE